MKLLRDKRGVTLLELMVVLAIIGTLLVVAVPYYYAMLPHLRVKGAARDVAEALQIARMKAVARNTTYIVQFNDHTGAPAPANYFSLGPIIAGTTFTNELDSSTYNWTGVDIYYDWLSTHVAFTDPTHNTYTGTVFFHSDGTASVDGDTVLGNQGAIYLLPSNHSECYRVLVDELTGKATIQYLSGVQWVDS